MSDREDELILELILEEEQADKQASDDTHSESDEDTDSNVALLDQKKIEDNDYVFIEERDVTLQQGVFNQPAAEDEIGDIEELPIEQAGTLVDFVLIADDSEFSVKVEIDEHDIIDDTYEYISDVSTELSKIGGYEDNDGNYVVHVSEYEFQERCNVLIRPENNEILFKLIRLEADAW